MTALPAEARGISHRDRILTAANHPDHDIDFDAVPVGLQSLDRWFCWRWEWNGKKWTKIPVQTNGRNASSTGSETWTNFASAAEAAKRNGWGLGFALGDGIAGIDLDDCRDPESGELLPWAAQILRDINSYAEVSPSETGIKILLTGMLPEPFNKKHKHPSGYGEVEIYQSGRFFTITGKRAPGAPHDIAKRSEALSDLYKTVSGWKPAKPAAAVRQTHPQYASPSDDVATALAALAVLDPGMDYEGWLSVGMCLHSVDTSEAMLAEFDSWSRGSDKYVAGDCEAKWKSFGGDGVTIRTLCHRADQTGQQWRPRNSRPSGNSVDSVDSVYGVLDWPELIQLGSDPVSDFPSEVLPSPFREFVDQLAEFTQTPVDLAGGMVLAAVATAVQKKYEVQPSRGWSEQLSLYVVSLLESANRKSAVVSEVAKPIQQFESELARRMGPAIRSSRSDFEVRTKQRLRLIDEIAKAPGDEKSALVRDLEIVDQEIADNPVLAEPTLLVDDITPEHAATKMKQNGGRIAVISPEGELFEIMKGRYSKSPNIGIFLKSHSGDEVRVDRGNRPSEHIKHPAMSMGFCVQPEVMRGLHNEKSFRGKGLLARYLYQLPESRLGRRKISPAEIDPVVLQDYSDALTILLEIQGEQRDGEYVPEILTLSGEALLVFGAFRERIELSLGEFGSLSAIKDWGGKLPGAVARIAGLLHLMRHVYQFPIPTTIDATTMNAAIRLGDYFISHANAAFQIMGNDDCMALAKHIVGTIQRHGLIELTKRDLHQHVRRRVEQPDDLDAPLKKLMDNNFIREIAQPTSGSGRKPSPLYEVHPNVLRQDSATRTQNTHNTQN